jgi:signal recognition particle subunit SRP54
MFESLSEKLEGALQSVTGQGRINEVNVAETMREIRRALLNADVNYEVAKEFTDNVKEEATGEEVLNSVTPGQQLTKIVYDELARVLGGELEEIEMADTPPTVILVAGLQGSGKTTFSVKLARHLKKQGHAPMLAASDVYRPAAVDQLKKLAGEVNAPV